MQWLQKEKLIILYPCLDKQARSITKHSTAPSRTGMDFRFIRLYYFSHLKLNDHVASLSRLDICQKIYSGGFSGQKFYTLKVRKLRQLFLTRNSVNALISVLLVLFCQNLTECVKFSQFQCKITLGVCKSCSSRQIIQEIALFSGKIYTAGTNFTRPPVVTVATNLNSVIVYT